MREYSSTVETAEINPVYALINTHRQPHSHVSAHTLTCAVQILWKCLEERLRHARKERDTNLWSWLSITFEYYFTWKPFTLDLGMQDLCIWLARRRTESLERDDPSKAPPAKPSPNSDDAGPIVRRPIGLQIPAGCDTTRARTQVCSDASRTAMQCLKC